MMQLSSEKVGTIIYMNMFEVNPKLKELFKFTSLIDFQNSDMFYTHINKVVSTITIAIQNLEHMEDLYPIL